MNRRDSSNSIKNYISNKSISFTERINKILLRFISPKNNDLKIKDIDNKKDEPPSSVPSEAILNIIDDIDSNLYNQTFDFNIYLKCFIHELRTPLSSISIGFELLNENTPITQLTEIKKDIKNSIYFIDKILTKFSVIQDSNIKLNPFEPFCIVTLLENVKNLLPRNLEYHNIIFQINIQSNIHSWYLGDSHNLSHVIINLLKNAVKYQNMETKNIINIELYKRQISNNDLQKPKAPSMPNPSSKFQRRTNIKESAISLKHVETHIDIIISISDNNNHILPHIKEKLFETFNSTSGSGLGLYICKTIIDLYNGTIAHEYIQPRGNKFIIKLKLEMCKEQSNKNKSFSITPTQSTKLKLTSIKSSKKYHICIVDDNELNCKLMFQLLSQNNIYNNVEICMNGKVTIQMMQSKKDKIEVIFLDKYMPEMNGPEVAKKLREMNYENIIFGLTGIDNTTEIQEFIDSGVDYVFTKPLTKIKLEIIKKFLLNFGTKRQTDKHIKLIDHNLVWV